VFKEPDNNPECFQKKIAVKKSTVSGWGVFATERIDKHEIFESCPLILFHKVILDDYYRMYNTDRHMLDDYLFKWKNANMAIALGYGSVYNHSNEPNATFRSLTDISVIEFISRRVIEPGEEIFIHYLLGKSDIVFSGGGTMFSSAPVSARGAKLFGFDKAEVKIK
jgi:SET domain-containing protein